MKHCFYLVIGMMVSMACNNKKGWTQADRDKLINSCTSKALSSGGLSGTEIEQKFKAYCTCYQQNLEKKYPSVADMGKASPKDISEQAAACIEMMK